jgi:hypothetical protein
LQVHYATMFDGASVKFVSDRSGCMFVGKVQDYTGVKLHIVDERPKNLAAVMLFAAGSPIPPRQSGEISTTLQLLFDFSLFYKHVVHL